MSDDKKKRKGLAASAITEVERIVSDQVPPAKPHEILEYLKLFGYKPDRTISHVHVTGFFNKKGQQPAGKQKKGRQLQRGTAAQRL